MHGSILAQKIAALQPLPTWLTSIRYPLYSMTVIDCAMSIGHSPNCDAVGLEHGKDATNDAAAYVALYIRDAAGRNQPDDCHVGWADIFVYRG